MSSLRDIFGSKSPHTVEKRATSLVRFLKWLQSAAFLDEEAVEEPLAPSEASVYRFCQHVSAGAKGKLAATARTGPDSPDNPDNFRLHSRDRPQQPGQP